MKNHRVTMDWLGEPVQTLADLWPQQPKAVIVGINPAPVSVAAGHYYQGQMGQALFRRLREAGVLVQTPSGFEDDHALQSGIGFTDVVKRPTASGAEVRPDELLAGKALLERQLIKREIPLVIFAFKKSAVTLLGHFSGNGFLDRHSIGGAKLFVMPGPYEASTTAQATLMKLRRYWLENA